MEKRTYTRSEKAEGMKTMRIISQLSVTFEIVHCSYVPGVLVGRDIDRAHNEERPCIIACSRRASIDDLERVHDGGVEPGAKEQ